MALVTYEYPGIILIKDGRVEIDIPQYELKVIARVRGTKGQGVYDADELKVPTPKHLLILNILMHLDEEVTVEKLLDRIQYELYKDWAFKREMEVSDKLFDNYKRMYKLKEGPWKRPISELLRKKILSLKDGEKSVYLIDVNKVRYVLEEKKFA